MLLAGNLMIIASAPRSHHTGAMDSRDEYADLPPRVDPADVVISVEPYEAVEPIRGVRRVSPYSPVAGIDEARLYAEIGTYDGAQPWRRRMARGMAVYLLVSLVGATVVARLVEWII